MITSASLGARQIQREIECAGFLRVGKRDRREVGIRLVLLRNGVEVGNVGGEADPVRGLSADTVHRGEHDANLRRLGRGAPRRHPFDERVDHRLIDRVDAVGGARHLVRRGRGVDPGRDLGVGGRHDLHTLAVLVGGAATEVDLVTVVGRRVVRGGDHDSRVAVQRPHGVGGDGSGQLLGQRQRGQARRGEHLERRVHEVGRAVPGVAADDDLGARADRVEQILRHAGGGAGDDCDVHPGLAGGDGAAQTRGAEGERAAEAGVEILERRGVAALGAVDDGREFGAGGGIGVVIEPGLRPIENVAHCGNSFRMAAEAETPRRVAPASIIASASFAVRMPPDAFTPRRPPTVFAINSTACTLAPPEG